MRIPHTVPSVAFEAFRVSEETQLLRGELKRSLRCEVESWDDKEVPRLVELALRSIAAVWAEAGLRYDAEASGDDDAKLVPLEELPGPEDKQRLLELLPPDLPFEMAMARLSGCEHYWRRAAEHRWQVNDPGEQEENPWRRLYCERHTCEYLERLQPDFFEGDRERCMRLLDLVAPHVHRLRLRQLRPTRCGVVRDAAAESEAGSDDDEADDADGEAAARELASVPYAAMPVPPDTHHVPMDAILPRLANLREIYINIGVIYKSDGIDWCAFEFSVEDSKKMGRGLANLKHLKKFSLTRSNLDQPRAAAILQGLAINCGVEEVTLSYCRLRDEGCLAVAAYLAQGGSASILQLDGNSIGHEGVSGLVHGLLAARPADFPARLSRLDLRLNPLGDTGANHLSAREYSVIRYDAMQVRPELFPQLARVS